MNVQGLLDKIEDLIDQGNKLPVVGKVLVDGDEIKETIEAIRYDLPAEIQKAQDVISQRKSLLSDAQNVRDDIIQKANEEAETIIAKANAAAREVTEDADANAKAMIAAASEQAKNMVEQSEITRMANDYSDRIREKAARDVEVVIGNAQEQAHGIVNDAVRKAEDVKDKSEKWADEIRQAATDYVKNIIKNSDNVLSSNVAELRKMKKDLFGE